MYTNTKVNKRLHLITSSALCIFLTGCSFGPGVLKSSRVAYNQAVHTSANEELLLNIVRLRYREPLQFLQIGNITSQYTYSSDLSLTGVIPGNGLNVLTSKGGFSRSEKPTISYKPLEGKQFVNQVLEETNIDTFLLLIRSGWNIERVSRILMTSVGELYNFPKYPSYGNFIKLIQLWDKLQDQGDLIFTYLPGKEQIIADSIPKEQVNVENLIAASQAGYSIIPGSDGKSQLTRKGPSKLVMQVTYRNHSDAAEANRLLGIQSQHTVADDGSLIEYIQFVDTLYNATPQSTSEGPIVQVPLVLRSFSNQLFGLSRAIQMPEKDQKMVKTYINKQGNSVDVRMAFNDLLNIRSSSKKPDNALVSVKHRGSWFFIDQDDGKSVSTFSLLTMLYSLQAGEAKEGPVLTIPVGG